MTSKLIYPIGNGTQALHNSAIDQANMLRELPGSVRNSLVPIIPVQGEAKGGPWTCPGTLKGGTWSTPAVTPDMPDGRRLGIHVIEVDGSTGSIDQSKTSAPFYEILVDGALKRHAFPSALGGSGNTANLSYVDSIAYTSTGAPGVVLRFLDMNGGVSGAPPSAQVSNITIKVTTIWF